MCLSCMPGSAFDIPFQFASDGKQVAEESTLRKMKLALQNFTQSETS